MNNADFNGVMAGGGLIENNTTLDILKNHVSQKFDDSAHQMLWLDGFPRDEKQVAMLFDLAIGKVFLIHLKIHNTDVIRRFSRSLEKDEERSTRPDNSMTTFMRRLEEYRSKETKILNHAHALKIPVIKREISNTENAAETFYFKHIHPENPHKRTHQPHEARHN
jgi:adenylate kinase family enzyme